MKLCNLNIVEGRGTQGPHRNYCVGSHIEFQQNNINVQAQVQCFSTANMLHVAQANCKYKPRFLAQIITVTALSASDLSREYQITLIQESIIILNQ